MGISRVFHFRCGVIAVTPAVTGCWSFSLMSYCCSHCSLAATVTPVYFFLSNPEVTSRQSWTFHLTPCVYIDFSSLLSETKLPQAHKHRHNIHATEEWTSGGRERPWCHERWGADPSKSRGQGLFSSYAFPEAARPEGRGFPACSSVNPWYLTASAWGIWRTIQYLSYILTQGTNKRLEGLSNIQKAHLQGAGKGYSWKGVCKSLICILYDSVVKFRILWLGKDS